MVAHTYSFSTWEVETGRSGVQDQLKTTEGNMEGVIRIYQRKLGETGRVRLLGRMV